MAVVAGVLFIIVLAIPALAFVEGMRFVDRSSKDITDQGRNTISFAGVPLYLLLPSLLVHVVAASVLLLIGQDTLIDAMFGGVNAADGFRFIRDLIVYLLMIMAIGFVFGVFGVNRVEYFTRHRWISSLAKLRDDELIFAEALTAPHSSAAADRPSALVVSGLVREANYKADGTLVYLLLERWSASPVEPTSSPFDGADWHERIAGGSEGRLVVEGRQITAVRYKRVTAPSVAEAKALQAGSS
jgi:hypothetical protein